MLVATEFRLPECSVACRLRPVLWAAMPKAAIYENSETMLGKDKVGLAE
jgi:hypothetical protein